MQGTLWLYSELMLLLEVVGIRPVGAGNFVRLARWCPDRCTSVSNNCFLQNPVATLALEFAITVFPMMISFTFAELAVPLLVSVYCLAALFSVLSWQHAKEFIHKHCRKEKMNQMLGKELPFLTGFRAQVMISTYVQSAWSLCYHSIKLTLVAGTLVASAAASPSWPLTSPCSLGASPRRKPSASAW